MISIVDSGSCALRMAENAAVIRDAAYPESGDEMIMADSGRARTEGIREARPEIRRAGVDHDGSPPRRKRRTSWIAPRRRTPSRFARVLATTALHRRVAGPPYRARVAIGHTRALRLGSTPCTAKYRCETAGPSIINRSEQFHPQVAASPRETPTRSRSRRVPRSRSLCSCRASSALRPAISGEGICAIVLDRSACTTKRAHAVQKALEGRSRTGKIR